MNTFRKPGPRFAAEAIAIILAAAIPGLLHLAWWEIGICVVVVLLAAVWVESIMSTPAPAPATGRADDAAALPPVSHEAQHVRVLQEERLLAPEPEPMAIQEPELEPEPVAVAVAAPPVGASGPPYNVWELERALEASGSANDEQSFLLQYLRDYAAPDGKLPTEFDDLVRESFPSLL